MKEKMVEFLLKRLTTKADSLRQIAPENFDTQVEILDDIDLYLDELKSLLSNILM